MRAGLEAYDLGRVETLAGAAGGVRFIPCHSEKANEEFLTELALQGLNVMHKPGLAITLRVGIVLNIIFQLFWGWACLV